MDIDIGELADLLYIDRNTVSNWENDKRRVNPKRRQQIAEVVAAHTHYDVDAVVEFLTPESPASTAERRRPTRKSPPRPRKPGRDITCIHAVLSAPLQSAVSVPSENNVFRAAA